MGKQAQVDATLGLDAVYYSAPIPRTLSGLTALGFVFDRLHFPGVYLPKGDYDRKAWALEIDRIAALQSKQHDTRVLLACMRFASVAEKLEGFCCFGRARDDGLDAGLPDKAAVEELYQAVWGPPRDGFIPMFSSWHHKGVPNSEEHLTYPGDYFYQAGAIKTAGELGFPIITDVPGMPVPGTGSQVTNDAQALAAFIALETMQVVLPELPLLRPEDLMEFREDNQAYLRGFRRAMLRYAGEWRGKLAGASPEDIKRETEFLIKTEIVPALDELRQLAADPARPWHKRAVDGIRIVASVTGSCMTMRFDKAISQLVEALAPQFFQEVEAKGDKSQSLKRSDLYYLLRVQAAGSAG